MVSLLFGWRVKSSRFGAWKHGNHSSREKARRALMLLVTKVWLNKPFGTVVGGATMAWLRRREAPKFALQFDDCPAMAISPREPRAKAFL